jgi:hypothetical protein
MMDHTVSSCSRRDFLRFGGGAIAALALMPARKGFRAF